MSFTGRCRIPAQQLERDAASSVSGLCLFLYIIFLARLRMSTFTASYTFSWRSISLHHTQPQSLNALRTWPNRHDAIVGLRLEKGEGHTLVQTQNLALFFFMNRGMGVLLLQRKEFFIQHGCFRRIDYSSTSTSFATILSSGKWQCLGSQWTLIQSLNYCAFLWSEILIYLAVGYGFPVCYALAPKWTAALYSSCQNARMYSDNGCTQRELEVRIRAKCRCSGFQ